MCLQIEIHDANGAFATSITNFSSANGNCVNRGSLVKNEIALA